jgi:hypothetical protein
MTPSSTPAATPAMPGMPPTIAPLDQLHALIHATGEVLNQLELLESCRFGPAEIIEAAVIDLDDRMQALDQLGPRGGLPPLRALHDPAATGLDAALANQLAATVRGNLDRIREGCVSLSLELRRLLADTREVVSVATGSAGTYDAHGRTTAGQVRRTRGLV